MKNLLALLVLPLMAATAHAEEKIDFAHDVLPILRARCAECHTGKKLKGGVSLDTREATLKSEILVVGKSSKSELIKRITSTDPKKRMPPKGKPLDEKQIATLKRWIDEGLPWQEGFSFSGHQFVRPLQLRPVQLPKAPADMDHPIDRIIFAYQQKNRVKPTERLSDAAFLRRSSLDVIGLLPSPTQLDNFRRARSENKRERWVKSLLSRDRQYTEHWLTFWNDLLRNDYRGTGYIDGGRKQITGWLYRSLMENKPYDQFVRELISPTAESEGFIRGIKWRGRVNASQVRELQFAQNVGQVFLGANLKCASCHDSFIDDWKLTDSYGLAAITADGPMMMYRCDKPTGETAKAKFLFPELGTIDGSKPRQERLKQLAELITTKKNGRFARTIVNRLWERLMGRGLVHPVDVMRNPAWSEELLDYLASHLIENKYDLKKTIELILTSRAYQSESVKLTKGKGEEKFVFCGPRAKRMTAEQFIDAMWDITGTTPARPNAGVGNRGDEPVRASLMVSDALMRSLGRPNREQVVTTRPAELTTLQALDLSNGPIMADLVDRGAKNLLARNPKWTNKEMTDWLWLSALNRLPSGDERKLATQLLGNPMTAKGLSDVLWGLFMLPEFQMVR